MEASIDANQLGFLGALMDLIVPITTFILGFLASHLSLARREMQDYRYELLRTSKMLINVQTEARDEFAEALRHYSRKKGNADREDFFAVSTKGQQYFNRVKMTCDAILDNRVDEDTIRKSIFPKVKEVVETQLPEFYSTLGEISHERGEEYSDFLRREDYESIYRVYESLSE